MKNSKIQRAHGRGMVKHPKAVAFERDFGLQCPPECRNLRLGGPLRAIVTVWYPSRRQDLDCALVYDCLQKMGVVVNDRDIIEKHEFGFVDPKNPRVEILIEEI